jgi:hypothetical protein
MAGDWIKMRINLPRDPKVIVMADALAEDREFMDWLTSPVQVRCDNTVYEHVTRYVTVALCVTALLHVWGVARDRGKRIGDALELSCCDKDVISVMADVPGFGAAMELVEWVVFDEGNHTATFPNFFQTMELNEDRYRTPAAERQARYRAKKAGATARNANHNAPHNGSDVTRDVTKTVTRDAREEESRVDINIKGGDSSIAPFGESSVDVPPSLNPDFLPSDVLEILKLYPVQQGIRGAHYALTQAIGRLQQAGRHDPVGVLKAAVTAYAASDMVRAGKGWGPKKFFEDEHYNDDQKTWADRVVAGDSNGVDQKPVYNDAPMSPEFIAELEQNRVAHANIFNRKRPAPPATTR